MKKIRKEGIEKIIPIDYLRSELEREALALQREKEALSAWRRGLRWQNALLLVLSVEFGFLLLFTAVVILLDGFGVGGFQISDQVINGLVYSTVGAVAGLITIAVRSLFAGRRDGDGGP